VFFQTINVKLTLATFKLLTSNFKLMKPIIEVHNLSKKYKIGAVQPRYLSLRDSLSTTFKGVKNWVNFDKSEGLKPIDNTDFWALKDINFTVNAGESIGIIGRNGAGKSTLLKILSRITPPTSGRAVLRGRLASLLEVGTGFHPELTGRENVYFNGSILGLRKVEIDKQFDEIVQFSGIEQFIDTPMKNYSSGMQLRLAFAVAAHLEPEILIIDEVLAVGDAEFQKKCLGKMDEVSRSGRTVIFVSHNMSALKELCQRGIVLKKGEIVFDGKINNAIDSYLTIQNSEGTSDRLPLKIDKILTLTAFDMRFEPSPQFQCAFTFTEKPQIRELCLLVYNQNGVRIAILDLRSQLKNLSFEDNKAVLTVKTAAWQMVEGTYQIGLFITTVYGSKEYHQLMNVDVPSIFKNTAFLPYPSEYRGFVEIEVIQ
jgi:lipopolysaccharide transport system ATP-binding protein